jgi:probable phosphoglycerate mutase
LSLTLYFLRHGQTACSRDNVFCGSGLDPELTPEGVEMAQAFADAYRAASWNGVYSSPSRRAITTAQPLCQAAGLTMNVREELKEIGYGQWEGQTTERVERDCHDDYLRWLADPAWFAPTGGERADAIAHRGLRVIGEIMRGHSDGQVLVVSHKATIRIILCVLLGMDVGRFRHRLSCPVASLTIVEFKEQGPLLRVLADRTHLSEHLRNLPGT